MNDEMTVFEKVLSQRKTRCRSAALFELTVLGVAIPAFIVLYFFLNGWDFGSFIRGWDFGNIFFYYVCMVIPLILWRPIRLLKFPTSNLNIFLQINPETSDLTCSGCSKDLFPVVFLNKESIGAHGGDVKFCPYCSEKIPEEWV